MLIMPEPMQDLKKCRLTEDMDIRIINILCAIYHKGTTTMPFSMQGYCTGPDEINHLYPKPYDRGRPVGLTIGMQYALEIKAIL